MSLEITGLDELKKRLIALGPSAMRMAGGALYQEAAVIKEKAFQLCPKDINRGGTGHLRNSLWVQKPEIKLTEVSVTIHAGGGEAAPYALAVHEHLSEYSPPSWKAAEAAGHGINWSVPGTGPKFLEKPVLEAQAHLGELLARRLDLKSMVR